MQIALSAVIGAVASVVVLLVYDRASRAQSRSWTDAVWLALVVGLSILIWRAAGNTPSLNDDPIPAISPNDVLCAVLTFVCLEIYAGVSPRTHQSDWPRERALLTLVSLVVNIVTI